MLDLQCFILASFRNWEDEEPDFWGGEGYVDPNCVTTWHGLWSDAVCFTYDQYYQRSWVCEIGEWIFHEGFTMGEMVLWVSTDNWNQVDFKLDFEICLSVLFVFVSAPGWS